MVGKVDDKSQCQNNEYYIPHKAIMRETESATKVHMVPHQKVTIKMCY